MRQKIDKETAQALSFVIHKIRYDWHQDAILNALGRAKDMGDVGEVARAAITAALDPNTRSPAVIPTAGSHWQHTTHAKVQQAEPCPVHTPVTPAWNCAPCRAEYLTTGTWPENTKHHQAERQNDD